MKLSRLISTLTSLAVAALFATGCGGSPAPSTPAQSHPAAGGGSATVERTAVAPATTVENAPKVAAAPKRAIKKTTAAKEHRGRKRTRAHHSPSSLLASVIKQERKQVKRPAKPDLAQRVLAKARLETEAKRTAQPRTP